MKKTFLFAALAALSMVSCTNNELPEAEPGYGYINLNVSNDVAVTTRAGEGEGAGETTPSWIISATKNGETYSGITSGENVVPAGAYKIEVKSHESEANALTTQDGWGEPYYEGNSGETAINVIAGSTNPVTIACGKPKNTKVTGQFNLTTGFTKCVLTLDPTDDSVEGTERNLEIKKSETDNKITTNASAFFSPGTVKFNFSYTYEGQNKKLGVKTITTTAGHEHIIKISSNNNGKINLSISTEGFENGTDSEFTFDAATGDVVNG